MSNIDSSISNEAVIPVFETDLFDGHDDSRFAIGIIAVGDEITPGCEDAFSAYLRLRANVYADQTRMIDKELVNADGTETDADDSRSVHWGIFENHALGARAVGAIRLIIKSEADPRPLPIEEFFPEVFTSESPAEGATETDAPAHQPAPLGSVEVSRYIARHEKASTQASLSTPLFSGPLAYISANHLGPTYATVETAVEASLKAKGVPFQRIAEPKYVAEYSADNLGIEVDTDLHIARMETHYPGTVQKMHDSEGEMTYFGRQPRVVEQQQPEPVVLPPQRELIQAVA